MSVTSSDLEGIRVQLSSVRGAEYWRRMEELAKQPEFQAFLRREFPSQAARFDNDVPRRDFLRLMGASLAVAGLGACTRQPDEKILPFASSPEEAIPGKPLHFSTAMPLGPGSTGLLIESHDGRPTKVEGNPNHPSSLGSTDGFAQAALLGLYDPDRSQTVLKAGQISTWEEFSTELRERVERLETVNGEGLYLLTQEVVSPTLGAQLREFFRKYSLAKWVRWQPLHRDNERHGARIAFGRDVTTRLALDRAQVVLSLDADFLVSGPGGVRNARDFALGRRVRAESTGMNRLYVVESSVTATGAMADERLPVRPSKVEAFTRALASELGIKTDEPGLQGTELTYLRAVADDLTANGGACLVVAGQTASPAVHALTHAINAHLGNVGRTVSYTEPVVYEPADVTASIRDLINDVRGDRVKTLVMLGGNPVLDAGCDLEFTEALKDVAFRVHHSLYEDETSELCHWHVPATHFLESWSDARAHDGTVAIVQPLIAPLFDGVTEHEMIATMAGEPAKPHDIVREHWRAQLGAELSEREYDAVWRTALHDGVIGGTQFLPLEVEVHTELDLGRAPEEKAGVELAFRADPAVYDGRFANNGWLQETPRPLTRLVWDNAALIGPQTARALEVESGDRLEVTVGDRPLTLPAWVTPGHPEDSLTLHVGHGRRRAGRVGTGVGVDVYRIRPSYAPWSVVASGIERVAGRHQLVSVQDHAVMEGRDIVRVSTFDRFRSDPAKLGAQPAVVSMYAEHAYEGYAWGMVIDLNACVGCNACMLACQSENNIPIVGKEEVDRGREMHWIRIDRYYEEVEGRDDPQVLHQPVPCMHCENAPCEVVCPVGATVHGSEGLNEMVYNRCIGTRYCSNNCPYKVRRFNFFGYADSDTEVLKLGNNPDVTVRSRGVMEKCTYCVQRINQTRIDAKKQDRSIREGELQTACQQVCPTQAIVFGDVNDESSAVSEARRQPHEYGLLAELGTKPRTTYLAKLTNPNPHLRSDG